MPHGTATVSLDYDVLGLLAMGNVAMTSVFVQPQVSLKTLEVVGYEALLRLRRGNGSAESPLELFERAEHLDPGARNAFHLTVLKRVLPEAYRVQRETDLTVSVNIHPCLLHDMPAIEWLLAQHVQGIVLELVESGDITNFRSVNAIMDTLRRHGFKFSIDDYGKSYSTASVLASLHSVDEVKIDASFLRTPRGPQMLPSMCQTIHCAGALATVEGIESPEDHEVCVKAGADRAQGYWYGLPQPIPIATHAVS